MVSPTLLQYEVFAFRAGQGMTAGVVLGADGLDHYSMQSLAKSAGIRSTAFVCHSSSADYRLRYFSAHNEIPICGHATIAASFAIAAQRSDDVAARRSLQLETGLGLFPVTLENHDRYGPMATLQQGTLEFMRFSGSRSLLAELLGLYYSDLYMDYPVVYCYSRHWTLIVPVRSREALRRVRPTPGGFGNFLADGPDATILPFCFHTADADAHLRAMHFPLTATGGPVDLSNAPMPGVLAAYVNEYIDPERDPSAPLLIERDYGNGREGRLSAWASRRGRQYTVSVAGAARLLGENAIR
jgi:PhzF family phenazine biosynthesis protein